MATSSIKKEIKSSKGIPQLNRSQKGVLKKQWEEVEQSKMRLANMILQLDTINAQLEEHKAAVRAKEKQFQDACLSALQGAGIDLDDQTKRYTIDVTDMTIKEANHPQQ